MLRKVVNKWFFITLCLITLAFVSVLHVHAEGVHSPHQNSTEAHHSRGFKILGVDFAIISGILTLTSLLTTFTIGMLRRFGRKKLNMNLHHYAAYTTVILACLHAIYNFVTHL